MNKYVSIAVLLVVLVGLAYVTNTYLPAPEEKPTTGESVMKAGTVVEVNKDQAAFDGPILITLQDASGMKSTIAVPSMGLPLCEAYKNNSIKDPFNIAVGEKIEVSGAMAEDGSIVPCESKDHYLR